MIFSQSPIWSRSSNGVGADGYGKLSTIHIAGGGAFLTEVVLTSLFVFIVLAITNKLASKATAGVAIGLALSVVHLMGVAITGTSVNPARSLGPALVTGGLALSQVWLFIISPLIGGAVTAVFHWVVFPISANPTLEASPTAPAPPGPRARAAWLRPPESPDWSQGQMYRCAFRSAGTSSIRGKPQANMASSFTRVLTQAPIRRSSHARISQHHPRGVDRH